MADASTDIRTLIQARGMEPDRAAVAHVLTSSGFLAVGSVAAAAGLLSMSFPAFIPLGYGIIRPLAMLALMIGFAALSVIGGAYYVLPRLTGTPLWNEALARLGLLVTSVTTVVGMVAVGVGLGDGGEPFALPWWLDLPMLAGLAIPALVAFQTVRRRVELHTFATIPFVVTGLVALPLLYVVGNIPGTTALADTLGDFYFSSAFLVAAVILGGIGLVYYAIVKQGDRPLAGGQLIPVGYWSLLFGAGWFGVVQLAGGPVPDWLGAVAAVLGLAFPVAAITSAAAVLTTMAGAWRDGDDADPVAVTAVAGIVFTALIAVVAAIAGFRSASVLVAMTPFWEGVTYAVVLGAAPLLLATWTFQALPRMTGRRLFSAEMAYRQVRLTLWGAGGLLVLLVLSGVITGYSWAGGAFTGSFSPVGEGWETAAGPAAVFVGVTVVAGVVAAAGNLTFASLVFRTVTQGRTTTQEVLVLGAVGSPTDE